MIDPYGGISIPGLDSPILEMCGFVIWDEDDPNDRGQVYFRDELTGEYHPASDDSPSERENDQT
jgi:hypothetical protein